MPKNQVFGGENLWPSLKTITKPRFFGGENHKTYVFPLASWGAPGRLLVSSPQAGQVPREKRSKLLKINSQALSKRGWSSKSFQIRNRKQPVSKKNGAEIRAIFQGKTNKPHPFPGFFFSFLGISKRSQALHALFADFWTLANLPSFAESTAEGRGGAGGVWVCLFKTTPSRV